MVSSRKTPYRRCVEFIGVNPYDICSSITRFQYRHKYQKRHRERGRENSRFLRIWSLVVEFLCSSIYSSSWNDRTGSRTRYNISSHFVFSASRFFELAYTACWTIVWLAHYRRCVNSWRIYGIWAATSQWIGTILSTRANLHDTI